MSERERGKEKKTETNCFWVPIHLLRPCLNFAGSTNQSASLCTCLCTLWDLYVYQCVLLLLPTKPVPCHLGVSFGFGQGF